MQNILLTLAKEADTYVTYLVLTQIISQEVNNVQTLIRSANFFAVHNFFQFFRVQGLFNISGPLSFQNRLESQN